MDCRPTFVTEKIPTHRPPRCTHAQRVHLEDLPNWLEAPHGLCGPLPLVALSLAGCFSLRHPPAELPASLQEVHPLARALHVSSAHERRRYSTVA